MILFINQAAISYLCGFAPAAADAAGSSALGSLLGKVATSDAALKWIGSLF